jgi:putative heme-binding domain-containing protein
VKDPSPQVRRECAIALHEFRESGDPSETHHIGGKARLWAQLALQHDCKDRWYLEALGIGAGSDWDACLNAAFALLMDSRTPQISDEVADDIIWRSRSSQTPRLLADGIEVGRTSNENLPRTMRAFDFLSGPEKDEALFSLAFGYDGKGDQERANFVNSEAIKRLGSGVKSKDGALAAINKMLDRFAGTSQFVSLVAKFDMADRYPALIELAIAHPSDQLGVDAVNALIAKKQWDVISEVLNSGDEKTSLAMVRALAVSENGGAVGLLMPIVKNADKPAELRRQSTQAVGASRYGAQTLIKMAGKNEIDTQLIPAVAASLHASSIKEIRNEAQKLFPLPPSKDAKPLPAISELIARKGDVARGKAIFETTGTCANCHIVNKQGKDVGPDLSEIGKKLSRTAFFESILFPSAGIAHNYEMYSAVLNDGNVVAGLLISKTDQAVTIRNKEGINRTIPTGDVDQIVKQKISIMPADLQKLLSEQDLVDVVEYLTTLKKAKK